MGKRIIYANDEGGMSILIPAPDTKLSLEELAEKDIPRVLVEDPFGNLNDNGVRKSLKVRPYLIVEEEDIPTDREFRNAWRLINGQITTSLDKAKEIVADRVRAERQTEFDKLDVEYMRALERNDTARLAEIAVSKEKLRDAPAHDKIAKATSVDQLKGLKLKDVV